MSEDQLKQMAEELALKFGNYPPATIDHRILLLTAFAQSVADMVRREADKDADRIALDVINAAICGTDGRTRFNSVEEMVASMAHDRATKAEADKAALEKRVREAEAQLSAEKTRADEAWAEFNKRDGNWLDKWGCCKLCDGDMPGGHTPECHLLKQETELTSLRAENERLTDLVRYQRAELHEAATQRQYLAEKNRQRLELHLPPENDPSSATADAGRELQPRREPPFAEARG